MKKAAKLLAIIILLLLILVIATPIIFKGKIIEAIKTEANNNLNAKFDFSAVDLSLITTFPNLKLSLDNVSIINNAPFDGDTLFYSKQWQTYLGLMDVIFGNEIKIKKTEWLNPYLNIIVLEDGTANYNIAKPISSPAGTGNRSNFKMALQKYVITNGRINYDDKSIGYKMALSGVNHSGTGDFTSTLFDLQTNSDIDNVNVWYGGIKYLSNVHALANAAIGIDINAFKFTFKQNELKLNDLASTFDGWVAMPADDISMDIKWRVLKNDFRSFMSLIPGIYSASFNNVKCTGTMAMDGMVKGVYSTNTLPAYQLNVKIDNGNFKYPSLPSSIQNVNVVAKINNSTGQPDNTVIDIARMHVEIGGDPFDAKIYVATPVSDANIDASIVGRINLGNLKNTIPLPEGTTLSGVLDANMQAKGKYSAIEQKRYENFDARGTLNLSDMQYNDSKNGDSYFINQFALTFNPKNVTLNKLFATVKNSDINATGTMDNLLGYYMKGEILKGSFTLNANKININDWMVSGNVAEGTPADTLKMEVLTIPGNVDFSLTTSIEKLIYDNVIMSNVTGNAIISDQQLTMNNLSMQMMDGTTVVNGTYNTKNSVSPQYNLSCDLREWNIRQTNKTFNTIKKLAPITDKCDGKFSTLIQMTGTLDRHMQPQLNNMNAYGRVQSKAVNVSNLESMKKIAEALSMDRYKQLALANLNLSFDVKNGRVYVKPFEQNIAGAKTTLQGSQGIDQTMDYTMNMQIPLATMGAGAKSKAQSILLQLGGKTGINIALPDPLTVDIKIGGTVTKPEIKTSLRNTGNTIVNTVKQEIKNEVNNQIDKGKEKARAEAEKIIKDAETQADAIKKSGYAAAEEIRKQGYAAADRLVKEAKNPLAKIAAEKAAEKLKKETDKKVEAAKRETDAKAQKLIDEARKRADELLK